jgi:hypothetical protein
VYTVPEDLEDMGNTVNGPQVDNLVIDWNKPGSTPWTTRAGLVFEADFRYEFQLGSFPTLRELPRPGVISEMFVRYVRHLKSRFRNTHRIEERRRRQRSRSRRLQVNDY